MCVCVYECVCVHACMHAFVCMGEPGRAGGCINLCVFPALVVAACMYVLCLFLMTSDCGLIPTCCLPACYCLLLPAHLPACLPACLPAPQL